MISAFFLTITFIASAYLIQLIKSFGYMSVGELDRRAKAGDKEAARVYRARSHGLKVWIVLWSLLSLNLSVSILMLENLLPLYLALIIDIILLVSAHVILPWARWPKPSLKLASKAGPTLDIIISKLNPVLKFIDKLLGGWVEFEATQRIHSKEELLENLLKLPGDLDRVGKDEIRIARYALTFGDKTIDSIMTPKSIIYTIDVERDLTPIVLSELHDSGFSRFPVWQTDMDNIVGILYLKEATRSKHSSKVAKLMSEDVYYVNNETNLDQVLNAFLRTQHHLFIVVNKFEEVVGVVTIEDVLEQIIGRSIVDEFDKYDDLRAVAKQNADKIAEDRKDQTIKQQ